VVDVPGLGDDIQSIKAGILEIGDLFVVNKSDLDGADRKAHELRAALDSPVLMASAATGEGVAELCDAIEKLADAARKSRRFPFRKGSMASGKLSNPRMFPCVNTDSDPGAAAVARKFRCTRIDHIGIAVKNLEEGLKLYEDTLGISSSGTELVAEQNVKVAFLPCGDSEIELLESTTPDGAVARFIEKNGEGIQHIAIRVDDIDAALTDLKERGVRLIDTEPRYGAGGARIAFVHPKATGGVLLELCER
jgi:methylmalonyl-CoA/ethylmalonyl-CoA epimerase